MPSDIDRIFAEVQQLWGVPYVSAIHRQMATWPGMLEWAWEAVAPVFRDGRAQEAGWQCARDLNLAPLDPIPREALAVWGVDPQALATVRATVAGFVRVAPVNMMFAGLLKALLDGQPPGGKPSPRAERWQPPPALPEPPTMVELDSLDAATRSVLLRFAVPSDGAPFVPGLYRMLAHWPDLLAHLAVVLAPRLTAAETEVACDRLRARIDAAVPEVLAALPERAAALAMPAIGERAKFLAAGQVYRKTSPDLVVLGGLMLDAMPR